MPKQPRKPRVIAYTSSEGGPGGHWTKWTPGGQPRQCSALLFQDGSIWDFYNGWRPRDSWYTQLRIRQIRNEWKKKAANEPI